MSTRDKIKASLQYKSWYSRNKDKRKQYDLEWQIKYRYGITREEYIQLLLKQKGVCAICFLPETIIDKRTNEFRKLAVDHCHTTGKVRGLLCSHCNHGIGKFKDNTKLLKSAIYYLEEKEVPEEVKQGLMSREEYVKDYEWN